MKSKKLSRLGIAMLSAGLLGGVQVVTQQTVHADEVPTTTQPSTTNVDPNIFKEGNSAKVILGENKVGAIVETKDDGIYLPPSVKTQFDPEYLKEHEKEEAAKAEQAARRQEILDAIKKHSQGETPVETPTTQPSNDTTVENNNSNSQPKVLVETKEVVAPTISELTVSSNEILGTEGKNNVISPSAIINSKLNLTNITQPLILQTQVVKVDTGSIVYSRTESIGGGKSEETYEQYDGTYINNSNEILNGEYRFVYKFFDLENNLLPLGEENTKKIDAQPSFLIKEYYYPNPKLIDVKVDKTTVKKGEKVTYTLTFDKNISDNILAKFLSSDSTEYSEHFYSTGDTMVIGMSYEESGEKTIKFGTELGILYRNILGEYSKIAEISKENQKQLELLVPKVKVIDEDYNRILLKNIEKIIITHTDGSVEELKTQFDGENPRVIDVRVGDTVTYKLNVADELDGFENSSYKFSQRNDQILNKFEIFNYFKPIDKEFSIKITPQMHDFYDIYISEIGRLFDNSIYHVINPDYQAPQISLENFPKVVYSNLPVDPVEVKVSGISLEDISSVDIYYDGPKLLSQYFRFGFKEPKDKLYSTSIPNYENIKVGEYHISEAKVNLKSGGIIELSQLPDVSFKVSDDIFYKEDNHFRYGEGYGLILNKEDNQKVNLLNITSVSQDLGHLPKELKNRALTILKFSPLTAKGELADVVANKLIIPHSETDSTDYDLYYYLPTTGTLTKLDYHVENFGDKKIDAIKDVKNFTGLFVKAYKKDIANIADDKINVKVLTNDADTISVKVLNDDANQISKIKTDLVTDAKVLEKLPETITPNNLDLYDIKVLDKNGDVTNIKSEATVTLPVNPSRKVVKVVYYLPETGAIEELPFSWEQEYNQVTFKVTHFSNYGVVYEPEKEVEQPVSPKPNEETPKPSTPTTPSPSDKPEENKPTTPVAPKQPEVKTPETPSDKPKENKPTTPVAPKQPEVKTPEIPSDKPKADMVDNKGQNDKKGPESVIDNKTTTPPTKPVEKRKIQESHKQDFTSNQADKKEYLVNQSVDKTEKGHPTAVMTRLSNGQIVETKSPSHAMTSTTSLPNTGVVKTNVSLIGFILSLLGLSGLFYKGRHVYRK